MAEDDGAMSGISDRLYAMLWQSQRLGDEELRKSIYHLFDAYRSIHIIGTEIVQQQARLHRMQNRMKNVYYNLGRIIGGIDVDTKAGA